MSASEIVQELREQFRLGVSTRIEWRKQQLQILLNLLDTEEENICKALWNDLHKPKLEAMMTEVMVCRCEVTKQLNNLEEWSEPQPVSRTLVNVTDTVWTEAQPLGVVLIIAPWNYPLQLVLVPLAGAIAAGNCVLVKPSEGAPHTERVILQLLSAMDQRCLRIICGHREVVAEVLQQRFDHIFFTGSGTVGKIVLRAAAEHLTPVTLELGGKCPVYVADDATLDVTVKRLVWGKFCNAGQTCVAPDYVMCSAEMRDRLVPEMLAVLQEFYGEKPQDSPDFGRIIHDKHFSGLQQKLADTKGKVVVGGHELGAADELYLPPTIVTNVTADDSLMLEEIFGPILPIMVVPNIEEALKFISDNPKPLAAYIFSRSDSLIKSFRMGSSSGAFMANDVVLHCGMDNLPFGGVGASGMGHYHGKYTFLTFSHLRTCVVKDRREIANRRFRYPPYNQKKIDWVVWAMSPHTKSCTLL